MFVLRPQDLKAIRAAGTAASKMKNRVGTFFVSNLMLNEESVQAIYVIIWFLQRAYILYVQVVLLGQPMLTWSSLEGRRQLVVDHHGQQRQILTSIWPDNRPAAGC